MQRQDVVAFLEERFPSALAEEWDHTGLQVGPLHAPCRRVMITLDLRLGLLDMLPGVDLVLTHHPLLFRPPQTVDPESPLGRKLQALLSQGTACYAIHTPYDVAQGGLGERLAELIGIREARPLEPRGELVKLVVFVPQGHVEEVAQAVFSAGAGQIGRYGRCSFRTGGTGTFLPQPGTHPFIGEVGKEQHTPEVRLETVVPRERVGKAVSAMLAAHPYEEVAYDLYPLLNQAGLHGLGRIGTLAQPSPAREVIESFATALGGATPQVYGDERIRVEKVAVCGGSGGRLWQTALASGAQLYLTGEIGYHEGLQAEEAGLTVAALGHRQTEAPFTSHMASLLKERFPQLEVIER
ncbi:MAG: hypothetical protein XD60_1604 [Acetothermia bacterium 64_32]|nr:MAG: hypothetical protein XD60_1604 [Acetothermia bacterium 64_32]MBC7097932.1 Nif3-like dinuclear metal center hexameric protein [Candidatus Bipolaricaulota bacterium]HAF71395.1 Nif3-like dinuclear metal center hexameric protein [Candidatus Acetothermia bacterium]